MKRLQLRARSRRWYSCVMSRAIRSREPNAVLMMWLFLALLLMWLGALLVAPAFGQEEEPASQPVTEVPEPAIPASVEPPAEPDPEWSYRFLVPATMVLGAAAVVGAIIMYFVRVTKNRYRVIR